MKKVIYAISAIALIVFGATSCQKNLVDASKTTGNLTLTASVEQPTGADMKSYLDKTLVKWHAGDKIKVFDEDGGYTMLETQDEGTTTAVFMEVGTVEDGTKSANFDETKIKCAIYPYSTESTYSDNKISYDFPEVQTYVANSFGPGANVAVAKLSGESKTAKFTNACGMLKLSLKGNGIIKKITIKSNNSDNEKLFGSATIAMDAEKPVLAVNSTGEEVMTTLDVPDIYLTNIPTDFYISIPVGSFGDASNGGFIATLNDNPEWSYGTDKNTNVIVRSIVRAMPVKTFEAIPSLPDDYILVNYVGGSTRIDTGISLTEFFDVETDFYLPAVPNGGGLFGHDKSIASCGVYMLVVGGGICMTNFSGEQQLTPVADYLPIGTHSFRSNSSGMTLDGVSYEKKQVEKCLIDAHLMLFCGKNQNFSNVYFNNFKVTRNGGLIFSAVAVKRLEDGKAGLYDLVNGNFLTTSSMKELSL